PPHQRSFFWRSPAAWAGDRPPCNKQRSAADRGRRPSRPLWVGAGSVSTADFDLPAYIPSPNPTATPTAVAQLIEAGSPSDWLFLAPKALSGIVQLAVTPGSGPGDWGSSPCPGVRVRPVFMGRFAFQGVTRARIRASHADEGCSVRGAA